MLRQTDIGDVRVGTYGFTGPAFRAARFARFGTNIALRGGYTKPAITIVILRTWEAEPALLRPRILGRCGINGHGGIRFRRGIRYGAINRNIDT